MLKIALEYSAWCLAKFIAKIKSLGQILNKRTMPLALVQPSDINVHLAELVPMKMNNHELVSLEIHLIR